MGLDILLFRKDGGCPELVIESQRRRGKPASTVQAVIDKDTEVRAGKTSTMENLSKSHGCAFVGVILLEF
jgi:hypothetical protein